MPRDVSAAALHALGPQRGVFGDAPAHAFAPHAKRRWLHLRAHKINHGRFIQAKLNFYRLKRRAIFPSHFYYSGKFGL